MGDRMPLPVGPEERGRRRSWRRSAGASALAIVILVAVGLGVLVARGLLDDEADTPSGGGPWEQLPRPPANDVLRGPELGSAVWTGRELILLASFAYAPPTLAEAARRACLQPGHRPLAGASGPAARPVNWRRARGNGVDGQGSHPAVRNGHAHRLRPGRQHLATVCPSPHWVHLARRGSRTDLDRCRGAGLGRLQHRRHLGQADRRWPRRRLQPGDRPLAAAAPVAAQQPNLGNPGLDRPAAAGHRRIVWRCGTDPLPGRRRLRPRRQHLDTDPSAGRWGRSRPRRRPPGPAASWSSGPPPPARTGCASATPPGPTTRAPSGGARSHPPPSLRADWPRPSGPAIGCWSGAGSRTSAPTSSPTLTTAPPTTRAATAGSRWPRHRSPAARGR